MIGYLPSDEQGRRECLAALSRPEAVSGKPVKGVDFPVRKVNPLEHRAGYRDIAGRTSDEREFFA